MRLKDKVALITGGGTGIGRAIAELFAREGAKVAVSGRRADKLEKVVQTIHASGGAAMAIPGDVTDDNNAKEMVSKPIQKWHQLDILVNNAAVIDRSQVHDSSPEKWEFVMNVNVTGIRYLSKYIIPEMIKRGGGSIINISSLSGLTGQNDAHSYSASKGAVISLSKAMASTYAPHNIRVNIVSPALIETPMPQTKLKEGENWVEKAQEWGKEYPLGRIGRPMDIAYGCLYLASDEAEWVTGINLIIDGGRSSI